MTETEMDSDIYGEVLPSMDELLKRAEAKGRADAIAEIEKAMHDAYKGTSHTWECMVFDLVIEQIKEQKNE